MIRYSDDAVVDDNDNDNDDHDEKKEERKNCRWLTPTVLHL